MIREMPRFRVDTREKPPDVPGWKPIPLDDGLAGKESRRDAQRALAATLGCDHVIALCGLGTSLTIKSGSRSVFPTMSMLWESLVARVGLAAFEKVKEVVGGDGNRNIEELLSRCQMKQALAPTEDIANFLASAEQHIHEECSKSLPDHATSVHEDFLRRLVHRSHRQPRANLFTTNYDTCFETAAARIGLPVIDGFAFTNPPRFQADVFDYDIVTNEGRGNAPDLVPRLLRMYKLHGSVDWYRTEDGSIIKDAVQSRKQPVLIYPQSGKYAASYTPPFLEMMARFQALLRLQNVGILTICSGLNDLHISEPLFAAVRANSSLRLIICAPDLCNADARALYGNESAKAAVEMNNVLARIDRLIEQGDARLTLMNATLPDLVRLLPPLESLTESEQHEIRIRKLEADLASLRRAAPKS